MAIPGQASGGFTESSSSLRIFYVGTRNSLAAELTADGFTQTNPPQNSVPDNAVTDQLATAPKRGVLSASVAFTRPDVGSQRVGGPVSGSSTRSGPGEVRPVGLFINDADGNEFENSPAQASGQGPYVSAQGTMGARLFETYTLTSGASNGSQGDDLVYNTGMPLYASRNGYLTTAVNASGVNSEDTLFGQHQGVSGSTFSSGRLSATEIGIVTIVPDATHDELVFDQRI
jgi:hypothetical protein